jgi:hypothetical protein
MEWLRQLRGFHDDPRMEVQKRHARFRKGGFYPTPDGAIELQPSLLHKFRDFPRGDDTNGADAVSAKFETFAVPRLQPIRSRNPPDPNVGVRQNHRRASQSSLATGSNGSRNSRTESRRLRPRPSLIPRFSRAPTLPPAGRAQMEGPPKQVRHAHRLYSLSSVLARRQYRGSGHEMLRGTWPARNRS